MWYDLVVLAILVLATIRGAVKGVVWQLAVIAALVLCFVFAGSLSLSIAPHIGVDPPLNRWIAMFALYVVFAFVAFGVARGLRSWIEKAKFVEFDRHLGAVLGFAKGIVIALVLTFFAATLADRAPGLRDTIFHSWSGQAAAIIMDRLHPVMPTELHDVLEPYIHRLDRPELDLRHSHGPRVGQADPHGHGPGDGSHHGGAGPVRAPDVPGDVRPGSGPLNDDAFFGADAFFGGWFAPRSGSAPSARDTAERLREERSRLLRDISEVGSDIVATRRAIIEDIQSRLAGLPDRVALAVIRDWHADLLFFDPADDPDPDTDLNTSLDVRIRRQLAQARIEPSSLNSDLRNRLQSAERQ
jgi:Colicin V production protein